VIIATAGHVDHGKTSLVKHLTGTDTDRLAEEKRRGLSIDLGFAYYQPDPGEERVLGFIDVPGHQRFINTMISGVSGIDLGMLVIAADDSVMPQTREHLEIMRLLGLQDFILVITKIDRVDPELVEMVSAEAQELLAQFQANIHGEFHVSNETGEGIDGLQAFLHRALQQHVPKSREGYFRLSIDRSFSLKGIGLVVTGTILSGEVTEEDTLQLLPQGKKLRVRQLHAQDRLVKKASAGVRCALNLTGDVEKSEISKGDWLTREKAAGTTDCITALATFLDSPVRLKHGMPVKLYVGAKHLDARLGLFNSTFENEEEKQIVQVRTDEPVCCSRGDRLILRDYSEKFLLGGARVLDPGAARSAELSGIQKQFLTSLNHDAFADAVHYYLLDCQQVMNYSDYCRKWNLSEVEANALLEADNILSQLVFPELESVVHAVTKKKWQELQQGVEEKVRLYHENHSDQPGMPLESLDDDTLVPALLHTLQQSKFLVVENGIARLTGFKPGMSDKINQQWQQMEQFLEKSGLEIPLISEIENKTGIRGRDMKHLLNVALKAGDIVRISPKRVGLRTTMKAISEKVVAMSTNKPRFTVIDFRDYLGTGRNYAIELLDYLDSVGFTSREGNERVVIDKNIPEKVFG